MNLQMGSLKEPIHRQGAKTPRAPYRLKDLLFLAPWRLGGEILPFESNDLRRVHP